MKKILSIVGARPQFIKAAMVSRELRETGAVKEILLHTGQHYDANMSDVFFRDLELPRPDYHFSANSLSHGAMTGRMMENIEEVALRESPQAVLIYGDTNSTLAGALAGSKLHIPVIHVEAGLRSYNMNMPEEINRIVADRLSRLLLCPTETAVLNLKKEGFDHFDCTVVQVGDVMEDAAQYYSGRIGHSSQALPERAAREVSFILVTCHRQENTGSPEKFRAVVDTVNALAEKEKVIWPVHPRTRGLLKRSDLHKNVMPIDPVGYLEMTDLLTRCTMVVTDSGGLQKEAYFFGKFCITLREETEWTELVTNGYNILAGTDKEAALVAYHHFCNCTFVKSGNLYGGGKAAEKIKTEIIKLLG